MESLDGTILANALPSMAPTFGVRAIDLKIAITVYLVAVAICIPVSGPIGRRVGEGRLFCLAMLLFSAASAGCALTSDLWIFTAMRIVQGMAGSMMLPVGRLLVLRDVPKADLPVAVALLTWPALIAPIVAPLLGGLIVEHLSWHWIFIINVPIGIAVAAAARRVLPRSAREPQTPFDTFGFGLWALFASLLVGGVGEAASLPASITLPVAMGCAFSLLLLWRHLRRARHPVFPLAPTGVASFRHTLIGGSFVRMAIFANPLLLPLMLQLGFGLSPVDAGFFVLVGMLGNLGMKPLTTPILRRFRYRSILLVNGTILSIGFALFAAVGPQTPRPLLIALLVITGMARSMHFTALNTLAFQQVPVPQMSAANLLASSTHQINAALGAAISALAVEGWMAATGSAGLPAYHFAFGVVAAMALCGTLGALPLPPLRANRRPS